MEEQLLPLREVELTPSASPYAVSRVFYLVDSHSPLSSNEGSKAIAFSGSEA